MKLLFITQKVDKNDDLLGVYHEWIKRLALEFQLVSVVCLYEGEHDLPSNVKIYSLGKEKFLDYEKPNKFRYILKFYKHIWSLRNEYDSVFVHMNPEYLILAGPLWKLLRKNVLLWYAHYHNSLKLRVAVFFTNKVVTSVKEAFPFDTRKIVVLQQGIDVHKFTPKDKEDVISTENKIKILFVGRISPIKNVDILVKAFNLLVKKYHNLHLNIVGVPGENDMEYFKQIKDEVKALEIEKEVSFLGKIPNNQTPEIYNSNDIFVNLTKAGCFDKTTLEAMASGSVVLVSNDAFNNIFDARLREKLIFKERDVLDLSSKIENLINTPREDMMIIKKEMRDIVVKKHSLDGLIDKLSYVLKE
ncbi:MAG: hypothetical protein COU71_01245 [Parcubacteria group bacterium CG10_big_fil_rev_8_21_14_0_10_38_31]|nr:MAG: hypothetical protein COU71_01245 [Parcubacteria group bacterium CG10_big_fil_rev_8_21_14_0_10_38_31]